MDGIGFDRLVKALAASSARRQALRVSIGGLVGTAVLSLSQVATAKKKKKKKKKKQQQEECLELLERCDSTCRCCGGEEGDVACRPPSEGLCLLQGSSRRCCGLEGTSCDPDNLGCDCCDSLVCDEDPDDEFRCRPIET